MPLNTVFSMWLASYMPKTKGAACYLLYAEVGNTWSQNYSLSHANRHSPYYRYGEPWYLFTSLFIARKYPSCVLVLVNDTYGGLLAGFKKIFAQFTTPLPLNAVTSGPDAKVSKKHLSTDSQHNYTPKMLKREWVLYDLVARPNHHRYHLRLEFLLSKQMFF